MSENNELYSIGRNLALKKKFPGKKGLFIFVSREKIDFKLLATGIEQLYDYLVRETEESSEVVPIAASWILDNYYLLNQQLNTLQDAFKPRVLKKLPIARFEEVYFQVHYIAKKYLESVGYHFEAEDLIEFLSGYQKIYPLSSLEIWILPQVLKYELLQALLSIGEDIDDKIKDNKYATEITRQIADDLNKKRNPVDRVRRILQYEELNPYVLLAVLEGIRELDYQVEQIIELIEAKIHEEDLNLEEFTRARVLREVDLKQRISNIVKSLKDLSYINWNKLFEKVSIVEKTLMRDPAGVYPLMDDNSKDRYRHLIEEISANSTFSESEVSRRLINLCASSNIGRQRHVGFYLIDDGYFQFLNEVKFSPGLRGQLKTVIKRFPFFSFTGFVSLCTTFLTISTLILSDLLTAGIVFIAAALLLQFLPATNLAVYLANKFFTFLLPPALPPKLDFSKGIPAEHKTLVVVPCIASNIRKAADLAVNLERRFLANKDKSLYFALLSDYKDASSEHMDEDPAILEKLKSDIARLNKKHAKFNQDIFFLFHRSRLYNPKEKKWMGWERKRGKLMELNRFLTNSGNVFFEEITGNISVLKDIKYVITLDEDTMLPAATAQKLVGAMAHPLNKPVIDSRKGIVTAGYGFIQPRICIDPESESISPFTKTFVHESGYDSYSMAVSDIYQDLFNRANFIGKGIFDVNAVKQTIQDRFPENKLLSHDLIESCFAKAGFLSDTILLEDYPSTYQSFLARDHRWTRGDWQLLPWLKLRTPHAKTGSERNPLDRLSVWMILDNLRRSLVLPAFIFLFALGWFYSVSFMWSVYLASLFLFPKLFEVHRVSTFFAHKMSFAERVRLSFNFVAELIAEAVFSFVFILERALLKLDAILTTLYRLVRQNRLLEWTTHSETEHLTRTDLSLLTVLKARAAQISLLLIGVLFLLDKLSWSSGLILFVWLLSPAVWIHISKPYPRVLQSELLKNKQKMLEYAKRIWVYFDEYVTEACNFLPPDSIQLIPDKKITYKTSPTNIGFYLLSVLSAYDLGFTNLEECLYKLEKSIETLDKLPKYKGHLYNWYDIKILDPLNLYVSTVDSGNYIACLMLLEKSCSELARIINAKDSQLAKRFRVLSKRIRKLYEKVDFSFLYNEEREIFSIGFNVSSKTLDTSYYDLLASEARIASYVAIALGQIPLKHWFKLSRPLQIKDGKYYLMSWGGTMFEYLLPQLILNEKDNTLLSQTNEKILAIQKAYAKEHQIPWGISESSFNAFDFNFNYQYKMIGVPEIALKRYEENELVVSPYSTFLALPTDPVEAEENLHHLENLGALGPYGFFESIDFNDDAQSVSKGTSVQIYTAHHQGMSLVAVNNLFNDNVMVKRFHANDYVKACEVLLEEKIPTVSNVVDINQYVESKKFLRAKRYERERVRHFNTPNTLLPRAQIYSNGRYSVVVSNGGSSYSKFKDIYINRFLEDISLDNHGAFVYIKDRDLNVTWSATYQPLLGRPDEYDVKFYTDRAQFHRVDYKTETNLGIFVPPEKSFEIRELTLVNTSKREKTYEITTYAEVMLDEYLAGIMHPAFNKLFVETQFDDDVLIAHRRKRKPLDEEHYAFHFLLSEDMDARIESYETDRYKFLGRTNSTYDPDALNAALTNTTGTVLDPVFSMRRELVLNPGESKTFYIVYGYANQISEIKAIKDLLSAKGEITELSRQTRHYVQAKRNHLSIDPRQEILFQKVASRLIYPDSRLRESGAARDRLLGDKSALYRFGISGEENILVLKANSKNYDLVRQVVLMHEYFRLMRFNFDLVLLVEERLGYEESIERKIFELVENSLSNPFKNRELGVHIINTNSMSEVERNVLLTLARVVFDTSLGSLEEQINLASRYRTRERFHLSSRPSLRAVESIYTDETAEDTYEYYNGFGGFINNGRGFEISLSTENTTPLPWSNIIANENFGTLVTEAGLGYTWHLNSQMNKLTPWSNDFVTDDQGECLYLKDLDTKEVWSATPLPTKKGDFKTIHSQGYTTYICNAGDMRHTLTVFVAKDDPVKILKLTLSNKSGETKTIETSYFVEWVLGSHRNLTDDNLNVKFHASHQYIYTQNPFNTEFKDQIAFMATDQHVLAATADRKRFLGRNQNKMDPIWVMQSKKGIRGFNVNSDNCGALMTQVEVPAHSQTTVLFIMGQASGLNAVEDLIERYTNQDVVEAEFGRASKKWDDLLSTITVNTPDNKLDYLVNSWLLYQVVSCRLNARAAFYQAGGAFGFRDQLQDVMALIYAHPERVRNQIILCCRHQFKEGDVQHWWHEPTGAGVRTKISDDLLWLPYVVHYYIEKTGDWQILEEQVPFLEMRELLDEEEDLYAIPEVSSEIGSVLEHCLRAIERASRLGQNGLPLIGTGDWNDGLNSVGDEDSGESVWLGWFLYSNLISFVDILRRTDASDKAAVYEEIAEKLSNSLNTNGWDGEWYKRAFHDDGTALGSSVNNECMIDSISQSWGVISEAAEIDKAKSALESHRKYLEKEDKNLILLLTPPFENSAPFPGYIQGYPKGIRENGGQYTHGVVWAVRAYCMLNMADHAYNLFNMLNPITHSVNLEDAMDYKVEPYIMTADIYSNNQHYGRGGWSWYTGSAGWMYQIAVQDILGFKKYAGYFVVEPKIPVKWHGFSMTYTYKGSRYNIKVRRDGAKGTFVNGQKVESNNINLYENRGDINVEIGI